MGCSGCFSEDIASDYAEIAHHHKFLQPFVGIAAERCPVVGTGQTDAVAKLADRGRHHGVACSRRF